MLESEIGHVMTKLVCAFLSYFFVLLFVCGFLILSSKSSAFIQLHFRDSLNVSSPVKYWSRNLENGHNIKFKF